MKKYLPLLLALAMMGCVMAGCKSVTTYDGSGNMTGKCTIKSFLSFASASCTGYANGQRGL